MTYRIHCPACNVLVEIKCLYEGRPCRIVPVGWRWCPLGSPGFDSGSTDIRDFGSIEDLCDYCWRRRQRRLEQKREDRIREREQPRGFGHRLTPTFRRRR